jgi:hypothetical protein
VPVVIGRDSIDPAADEPMSGSLQAVVGVARALPETRGQMIWHQLWGHHIHDP